MSTDEDDESDCSGRISLRWRLITALLASELTGLLVIIVVWRLGEIFGIPKVNNYITAAGLLAIYHLVVDFPFDFLWGLFCRDMYRKIGWKKYIKDEVYFYGVDKCLSPIVISFKSGLAAFFLQVGFSAEPAALVAAAIQVPPYIVAFTLFSTPLLLRRERDAEIKSQAKLPVIATQLRNSA